MEGAVVGELIGYGLDDAEEGVRRDALEAFAGRAGGIAFDPSPAALERWRADRPYLVALRDRVLASLSDRSSLAREGAVLALLNFDSGSSIVEKGTAKLAAESAEILAKHFQVEPESSVRARIVFALAGAASSGAGRESAADISEPARGVVLAALNDSDPAVLIEGLRAARHLASAIPIVVEHFGNRNARVRIAALDTLSARADLAVRFRESIVAATRGETDAAVREAAQRALAATNRRERQR